MSSSSTEGLTKLEDQLTCPICLDHFTNPKFLPCFHSFCLCCLERVPIELVKGSHYLPCPTCRLSCPIPDKGLATLPSSFIINNLIEVHGLMKKVSGDQHTSCDNCDKSNIANRYCKQCAKFLCPDCLSVHNKWKSNATHETITFEEVASTVHQLLRTRPQNAISCTEHNELLKVFCETCQKLVCYLCTVKKHKNHEYDVVCDVYKKYRDAIDKSSLQPLNQEFDQLTSVKTILVSRMEEIDQQAETTSKSIDHTITEIKEHLDAKGKQMKETVSSARKLKIGVLKHQLDELETRLGQVKDCRNQVKQSVEVATPHQLLSNKEQLMKHSSNVIDSTGDKKRFQPLEQADIELEKAANIHSNIGDIKFSSPSSTKVALLSSNRIPLDSQPSTITVSLSLPDGSPAHVPSSLIKCRLIPPKIQGTCLVKESTKLGQYDILCTPVSAGHHQLHITIQNREIQDSPVGISVFRPISETTLSNDDFFNFDPDVLKLLLKFKDIPGLKCFPEEGRIKVISTDENEKEKIIGSFQEAYQRIVQNPQFKTGTLELPPSVKAEDVAIVLDRYNAKYHQCVFTYNTTSHSVGIITMSHRQFDQAKKLLKEKLTGEATTTPTSSENHYDSKFIKTLTISPGRFLTLKRGDMVKEQADVLVNAANTRLKHVGGLALALDKASNGELQKHSDILTYNQREVPAGQVAVTAAGGRLMCMYVIHAVGPDASEHLSDVKCQELIYDAVTNSLMQASHIQANSIVLPALSTGIYSINPTLSAQAMLNAITSFGYKKDLLSDIRIVILDKPTYDSFAEQMDLFKLPNNPGPSNGPPHTLERSLSDQSADHLFTGTGSVSGVDPTETHNDSSIAGQPRSYSSVTSNESISNAHYPSLPSIGGPPGLVPVNPPFTPARGNPTGATSGRHSTPVITSPSYSLLGSSGPVLLKPASFTPSSATIPTNKVSYSKADTKASGASSASSSGKPLDQECPVCLDVINNPKATECCKNLFCSGCLKKVLEHSPYCPTCKTPLKPVKGNQPTNGTMNSHTSQYLHLPGFKNCGTITIDYYFPSGTQKQNHPNPGQHYTGTSRTAYLPDNQEGRHVLKLLRRAFDAGLTFTIGTSTTSGRKNTVVWNDIHHKTSTHGGSTNYGYPDDTYLKRVQEELKAKGIY